MPDLSRPGINGRVALVTGGSRGIGAAVARALAEAGARVMLNGRDGAALTRVAEGIRASGGRVEIGIADLTDEMAVRRLRQDAEDALGSVELLIACAGGGAPDTPLADEAVAQWRATLEANLTATFLTLKTFLPPMYARRAGAVVTMSSSAGRQASGASAGYAAAKAGVQALTRQAAQEAAAHNVRINAIAPSAIVTDRLAAMPDKARLQIAENFPLKRLGEVGDVAAACLFLLSDASSWITGTTLDIAGGKVML